MFSATKLVGIAAAVALFGAMMLVVPFGSQDTQAPAAPAPEMGEVTAFTGGIQLLGQDRTGTFERYDWGKSSSGEQWTFRLTTTDPRYSGVGTGFHNVYEVGPDRTVLRVQNGRLFTKDEDGTWLSTGYSYQDPETTAITYVTNSTGEGTYAGLSAYSICEQGNGSYELECHGIVFEGEWPELPSDTPTEVQAAYGTP